MRIAPALFKPASDFGVFGRNAILEQFARGGGTDAGGVDVVLERDGNAVQRAAPLAAPLLIGHLVRGVERLVARHGDVGVYLRIVIDRFASGRLR